jgi:hypothetical protein
LIQSAGTLFFNVTTYQALHTALSNSEYNKLVWRPDAFGSICFLVSGVIAYRASPRRGWRPVRRGSGWWNTSLGAACFLACAAATLFAGHTLKSPRLRRLHELESVVERDVERIDAHI